MSTLAERRKADKREVKTVERYRDTDYIKEVIEGEGTMIKEIPQVKAAFKSCPRDQDFLEIVHKAMYGTIGKQDVRRKEIMAFKGFKGKDDEATNDLADKKKKFLSQQTYVALIEMCRLFCLAGAAKTKTKEKYAEEIVKFLEKPGSTKIVVTPKDKVAIVEEEEEDEEPTPKKKPTTRAKKTEEKKKTTKKEAKATPKKGGKKEKEAKATPKKTAAKKEKEEKKATTPKKTTKKEEEKKPKTPAKKETKKGCCRAKKEAKK